MRLKSKKTSLIIIIILMSLWAANFCLAGDFSGFLDDKTKDKIDEQAGEVGQAGGYLLVSDTGVLDIVQVVINAFLSLIGVILLVYLLYAGYNWMTAQGEEEKVTKAKDTIKRAIIGAIIIIAAYAISIFVIERIEKGTLKGASASKTISLCYVNQL